MTQSPDTSRNRLETRQIEGRRFWLLAGVIALCTVIETVLSMADYGLMNSTRLRQSTYEFGGFWSGLLRNWQPNYTAQPYTMFVTYAFLHGGPVHLVVNMLTLWSLGRAVLDRVGPWGFAILYLGATLGGAACFGLLAETQRPMVGASGALFGLVGGILAWNYVDRFSVQARLWPVARAIVLLVAVNLVLWWVMDGQLAWETHLGGFVAGWIVALLIDPRGQEL